MRLLELPDEIVVMVAAGRLSEGHGRALLMASDHAERRRLGRAAAEHGWNVRQTEAAARAAGEPPALPDGGRRRRALHPDQQEAVGRLDDAFGRALGAAVQVSPRGTGYKVSLAFDTLEEALAVADRLAARTGA
jgi:ParB family chromosome partitioning protein